MHAASVEARFTIMKFSALASGRKTASVRLSVFYNSFHMYSAGDAKDEMRIFSPFFPGRTQVMEIFGLHISVANLISGKKIIFECRFVKLNYRFVQQCDFK